MTRRALLAALALALAFTAGLAIGRAGAAVPSHPVYVGPYTPVRVAAAPPRGSALPVTEPSAEPTPSGAALAVRGRHSVSGTATWYCALGVSRCTRGHPAGCLCAAISPDLRYLGSRLRVCAGERCVTVRVVDCNCQAHHSIDLYAAAYVQLAPLSSGRIKVTISHG